MPNVHSTLSYLALFLTPFLSYTLGANIPALPNEPDRVSSYYKNLPNPGNFYNLELGSIFDQTERPTDQVTALLLNDPTKNAIAVQAQMAAMMASPETSVPHFRAIDPPPDVIAKFGPKSSLPWVPGWKVVPIDIDHQHLSKPLGTVKPIALIAIRALVDKQLPPLNLHTLFWVRKTDFSNPPSDATTSTEQHKAVMLDDPADGANEFSVLFVIDHPTPDEIRGTIDVSQIASITGAGEKTVRKNTVVGKVVSVKRRRYFKAREGPIQVRTKQKINELLKSIDENAAGQSSPAKRARNGKKRSSNALGTNAACDEEDARDTEAPAAGPSSSLQRPVEDQASATSKRTKSDVMSR